MIGDGDPLDDAGPSTNDNGEPRRAITILVTSAHDQVSWLRCLREAATELGVTADLIATSSDPEAYPACLMANSAYRVPMPSDAEYEERIIGLCVDREVDLVIPGTPEDLAKLAHAAFHLHEVGTRVATGNPTLIQLSRDFQKLQEMSAAVGGKPIRTGSYAEVSANPTLWQWPLKVVPLIQQDAPLGEIVLRRPRELVRVPRTAPVLFHEILRGRQIVVQLLFDDDHDLVFMGQYEVEPTASGGRIATTIFDEAIAALAKRIALMLRSPTGPVAMTFMQNDAGEISLLRMTPMLTEQYILIDRSGANIFKWLIVKTLKLEAPVRFHWTLGLQMMTYPTALIVKRQNMTEPDGKNLANAHT